VDRPKNPIFSCRNRTLDVKSEIPGHFQRAGFRNALNSVSEYRAGTSSSPEKSALSTSSKKVFSVIMDLNESVTSMEGLYANFGI